MAMERTSIERSVSLAAPVHEVWAVAGDFHGIDSWHPGVARSVRAHVGDEEFRLLDLEGGGHIVEHLEGKTDHSYSYAILRGPLPVRHYHAEIAATNEGGGTRVTWSSVFEAVSDDAEAAIAGIYEAGLEALAARFGR